MRKLKNSKGFTLVEMLIVVAIIAILIAISIPLVNNALEKARHSTDDANYRAAAGVGTIEYLSDSDAYAGAKLYYYTNKASQGQLGDKDGKDIKGTALGTEYSAYQAQCSKSSGCTAGSATESANKHNYYIQVSIGDDGTVTVSWVNAMS